MSYCMSGGYQRVAGLTWVKFQDLSETSVRYWGDGDVTNISLRHLLV